MKHTVYLGMGSNVGDRIGYLAAAIRGIADAERTVVDTVSSVYVTEPVGTVTQNDFLNLAVSVRTDMDHQTFHRLIKGLEQEIGRKETERWGPREIDIDLLMFDHLIHHSDTLHIPHREIINRRFVLQPLAEIAPHALHPEQRRTAEELLADATDIHGVTLNETLTSQLTALINDSITNPTV